MTKAVQQMGILTKPTIIMRTGVSSFITTHGAAKFKEQFRDKMPPLLCATRETEKGLIISQML